MSDGHLTRPGGAHDSPVDGEQGARPKPGYVRNARERMENERLEAPEDRSSASSAAEASFGVPPLRPGGRTIRRPSPSGRQEEAPPLMPTRYQQPSPVGNAARRANPGAIGASISKPATAPQWPLKEDRSTRTRKLNNSPTRPDFNESGSAALPQPIRPSPIASLAGFSRNASLSASSPYSTGSPAGASPLEPWEDSFQKPVSGVFAPANTPSRGSAYAPSAPSSRPTTTSSAASIASIPDFPIPGAIPRKSAGLGPPSSRRGYSSYYSQSSFMPILEENSDTQRSHGSYASSHAIPSSWGSGPPQYFNGSLDVDGDLEEEEDGEDGEEGEDGRTSRSTDDGEERGLVRQASMGKRHKPSLTTIGSSDKTGRDHDGARQSSSGKDLHERYLHGETIKKGIVGRSAVAAGAAGAAVAAGLGASRGGLSAAPGIGAGPSSSERQGRLDQSSDETLNDRSGFLNIDPPNTGRARSPGLPASKFEGGQEALPKFGGLGDRDSPRPPRLNLNPPPEPDARNSSTSLPDLIRRATRLASVMDRGVRPASRLDTLYLQETQECTDEKGSRRSGSISDILASFPPPGLNSPREGARSQGSGPNSHWPSPLAGSTLAHGENASDEKLQHQRSRRRRCCGLPMWVVILLLVGFVLLIAAVLIPVALIVIPRQSKDDAQAAATRCGEESQCLNGGSSIADGAICRCVCVNGFTGDRCATEADVGCVTTDIGDVRNATLGSSIPRLLQEGAQTFRIPIDPAKVLSLFSDTNLSCGSENALVTFNGRSDRLAINAQSLASPTATVRPERRQASSPTINPSVISAPTINPALATSNDIVFAVPTTTSSQAAPSSPSSTSAPFVVDEDALEFARVSVLYILQQKNLDAAVAAQQSLQNFLGQTQTTANVNAGNGITVDFDKFRLDLGNGTVGGT